MLLRFFKSTGSHIFIIIPLIGILLWMKAFMHPSQVKFIFDTYSMPSYKLVTGIFPVTSVYGTLLTFLAVILQAFLLVRLNTQFMFINNRTYLPAFFYILLSASIPELQRLNPAVFSSFFLIIALDQLMNSYKEEKLAYKIFTASFFLSLGATFYPYLIFFMFIIWVGLILLRSFFWREWVFSILGFLTPWFFVFSYYYLFHNNPIKIITDFSDVFFCSYKFKQYSVLTYIFGGFILTLILLASQFIIKEFTGKKILTRKAFLIFLWLFINVCAVYILVAQASAELVFIGAIPVSFLLSHYFNFMRSTLWGDILFFLMIFLVVLIQL
jgi:hypothetical protein